MQQRGRKSSAALAVVESASAASALSRFERLPVPAGLSEAQTAVWRRTVDSVPGDWFQSTDVPMLVNYCRWVVDADAIQAQKDAFKPEWLETAEGMKHYERLTRIHATATGAIASLATKMRLTQQSRYGHRTAARKTAQQTKRPWEE